MSRGRKKARTSRNISGLRNQKPSHHEAGPSLPDRDIETHTDSDRDPPEPFDADDDYGADWDPRAERAAGLKPAYVEVDDDLDGERDEFLVTEEMKGEKATETWLNLAEKHGDGFDADEDEWLPPKVKEKKKKRAAAKKKAAETQRKLDSVLFPG